MQAEEQACDNKCDKWKSVNNIFCTTTAKTKKCANLKIKKNKSKEKGGNVAQRRHV